MFLVAKNHVSPYTSRIAASFDATGFALHGVRYTDAASHTTEPDRKLAILKNVFFPYLYIGIIRL